MKTGWKTHAIGRHLVNVPGDAKLIESWNYDANKIAPLPIKNEADLKRIIDQQETLLKTTPQNKHGQMFVERVMQSNGVITLVSWKAASSDLIYVFDTYFRADTKVIRYLSDVSKSRKQIGLDFVIRCSQKWKALKSNEVPVGTGFVVGDAMIADNFPNPENWNLSIKLAGKPDVSLQVSGFAQDKPEPGLRERAGGALTGMLGSVAGLQQLRNRKRPVGPIEADEILVAATQDGKRAYGFMWEAPGKGRSLAEPQLSISLKVGESAYTTNAESFATDEQALEVWDTVVDSIRLRPGAAG